MTNCLVTGGAGFIGSHLVQALAARGDKVRVFDNFSTGRLENLAGLEQDVEIVRGDLRDQDALGQAVSGCELVFHQAAFVSVPLSMQDPQVCFDINVNGTHNLLEACRKAGVGHVVLASSAAVYGEPQSLPLDEEAVLRPLSPYAVSKQATEIYAGLYWRAFNMPVTALRYFNVFGPRQSPYSDYAAVIPIFIKRLLSGQAPVVNGDGLQSRDFVFVTDVVRANLLASVSEISAGKVYNVCTGIEYTLIDLLRILAQRIPDGPPAQFAQARPGDIVRSLGDPGRAARDLGFRFQVDFSDGLGKSIQALRAGLTA